MLKETLPCTVCVDISNTVSHNVVLPLFALNLALVDKVGEMDMDCLDILDIFFQYAVVQPSTNH